MSDIQTTPAHLDAWPTREDGMPILGPPNTNTQGRIDAAVGWWVDWTFGNVEAVLGAPPTRADLSAYCHEGTEYFACDLTGADGRAYGITIVLAGELYLCPGDPDVVDAVSAIHLAGRLLARWSLNATVGGPVAV